MPLGRAEAEVAYGRVSHLDCLPRKPAPFGVTPPARISPADADRPGRKSW